MKIMPMGNGRRGLVVMRTKPLSWETVSIRPRPEPLKFANKRRNKFAIDREYQIWRDELL